MVGSFIVYKNQMVTPSMLVLSLFWLLVSLGDTSGAGLDWIPGAPASINELSHTEVMKMLSGKELIIIGDSVTRYTYMNLANFLHTGRWASRHPHPESEKHWPDWKTFQILTNWRLGGYEICDCYRVDSNPINITLTPQQVHRIPPFKENRHYYDPVHKVSVKFFWFTGFPMVMNAIPSLDDFASIDTSPEQWQKVIGKYDGSYEFRYDELNDLLYHQIRPRRPDLLVVNMGIWGSPGLSTLFNNQKNFTEYMKMSARYPIWKSTTATTKGNFKDDDKQIELFKKEGLGIFDTYNITWFMRQDWRTNYEDMFHFRSHAYRLINEHMLIYFRSLLLSVQPSEDSPHVYIHESVA